MTKEYGIAKHFDEDFLEWLMEEGYQTINLGQMAIEFEYWVKEECITK